MQKKTLVIVFFLLIPYLLFSQDNSGVYFYNTNTSEMIGMGGAFTAVPSSYMWAFYNPGAFLYNYEKNKNTTFVNISLPYTTRVIGFIFKQFYDIGYEADNNNAKQALAEFATMPLALLTLVKPTYAKDKFVIGFVPTEDLLIDNKYFGNRTTLAIAGRPVDWVSFGISAHYFYVKELSYYAFFPDKGSDTYIWGFGFTSGVIFKPFDNFHVGISYFHTKDELYFVFLDRERYANKTINFGLSYQINVNQSGYIKTAFDLRNPFFKSKDAFLEPHLGVQYFTIARKYEQPNHLKVFLIGGLLGWFYHRDLKNNWISAGIKAILQTTGFIYEITISSQVELSNRKRFFIFITFTALKVIVRPENAEELEYRSTTID